MQGKWVDDTGFESYPVTVNSQMLQSVAMFDTSNAKRLAVTQYPRRRTSNEYRGRPPHRTTLSSARTTFALPRRPNATTCRPPSRKKARAGLSSTRLDGCVRCNNPPVYQTLRYTLAVNPDMSWSDCFLPDPERGPGRVRVTQSPHVVHSFIRITARRLLGM